MREFPHSIESRSSWVMAFVTLAILSISYGSALIVAVGLKPVAASLAADRSAIALAGALAWLGMGFGGVPMGWVADRIGVRRTILFGAAMVAAGLALSTVGQLWGLYLGHGVLIGILGNGAIYPPLVIYVSRWFDRRRGTAIAMISAGQYIAGMIWPSIFEFGLSRVGWRATMLLFAGLTVLVIVPLALALQPPPQPAPARPVVPRGRHASRVLGMPPNQVQALLCVAGFLCCVPMAMPSAHLVAFCSDLGMPAAQGAAMLSVLLGAAFLSRQLWGWLSDQIGGLRAAALASACQAVAIAAFLTTQNEIGLFTVSAAFGLGFSGIVPAYVLAIRELFPSREASWRVPTFFLFGMAGMAFGSWSAGALYDHFGNYAPAFASGAGFNLLNLLVLGFLLLRLAREGGLRPASAV
ncbi:MAG TPA: MFS transporter [Stellaceae bacterium]|nr:MFS transporter [Stellaceae bacterium]